MPTCKAVCIGINYYNTKHRLNGCINDATDMKQLLVDVYKYDPKNILMITDGLDITNPNQRPTKKVLLDAFAWLVKDAQPGDRLVLSYSGHGSYVLDNNGDERDRRDEVMCALDGFVTDDEIHSNLISKLAMGVSLCCFFDCCHSGTLADLQYNFTCNDSDRNDFNMHIENMKKANGNVCMYSGCYDSQVSMDIFSSQKRKPCGAFTDSLLRTLKESNYKISKGALLTKINQDLKANNFQQICQLSTATAAMFDEAFAL